VAEGKRECDKATMAAGVLYPEVRGRRKSDMFLILFFVLIVMWLLGFTAFHVAGGLIHLLLLVAFISLIVHLFMGRRAV